MSSTNREKAVSAFLQSTKSQDLKEGIKKARAGQEEANNNLSPSRGTADAKEGTKKSSTKKSASTPGDLPRIVPWWESEAGKLQKDIEQREKQVAKEVVRRSDIHANADEHHEHLTVLNFGHEAFKKSDAEFWASGKKPSSTEMPVRARSPGTSAFHAEIDAVVGQKQRP